MLVTCKWFGPLEAFHQIKLRIKLNIDLIKWQAWEPKMQPWQVLHSVCVKGWGAWEALLLKAEGQCLHRGKAALEVWRRRLRLQPAMARVGPCWQLTQTCLQPGMLVLSSQPTVFELLFGEFSGSRGWLISLMDKTQVRHLNWLKCCDVSHCKTHSIVSMERASWGPRIHFFSAN